MSNGLIGHQPQPLPHHRHANSKNEPSWQRRPLPKIVPPWKATDGVLGSMDSVCALFYVFYWVFPRAKSKHTKSKRRGRKDSFLSFDDANKFVQLLTTLSTTIHGNHSGEILALRGGSLGLVGLGITSDTMDKASISSRGSYDRQSTLRVCPTPLLPHTA